MPDDSAARENQRLAYEIQTKFEFWLVGLIFAVLALAVQTATFTGPRTGQVLELAAWVVLLLAGLVGLWRMEWTPSIYRLGSYRARHEGISRKLREIEVSGHDKIYVAESREYQDLAELMKQAASNIQAVDETLEPLRKRQVSRYRLMRVLLITGFSLLLVARGYEPVVRLFQQPAEGGQPQEQAPGPANESSEGR